MPCREKTSREEGKIALLRRDSRTKFSHENLFLLKKTKARKSSISFTGEKKKSKQTEILRFCSEKESLVSLLLARQQGLVLISAEKSNDSGLKAGRKKKSPLLPPMLPPFWGAGPSSLPPSATSRLALSAQYQQPPRLENLKAVLGT